MRVNKDWKEETFLPVATDEWAPGKNLTAIFCKFLPNFGEKKKYQQSRMNL